MGRFCGCSMWDEHSSPSNWGATAFALWNSIACKNLFTFITLYKHFFVCSVFVCVDGENSLVCVPPVPVDAVGIVCVFNWCRHRRNWAIGICAAVASESASDILYLHTNVGAFHCAKSTIAVVIADRSIIWHSLTACTATLVRNLWHLVMAFCASSLLKWCGSFNLLIKFQNYFFIPTNLVYLIQFSAASFFWRVAALKGRVLLVPIVSMWL